LKTFLFSETRNRLSDPLSCFMRLFLELNLVRLSPLTAAKIAAGVLACLTGEGQ
jgi:hypothetical protein